MAHLQVSVLAPAALSELESALATAGLPTDDVREPGRTFLRFDDGELVGFGGIEGSGPDRLLRSLVVVPARRGSGLGSRVLEEAERFAVDQGTVRLHLLTTTAETFFRRKGYEPGNRASVPEAIAGSAQFASLCPASAAYLVKALG